MADMQLIEAVKVENISAARELIDAGCDIHQQDEQGWTPLNWASGRGSLETVRLLVEKGADVFKVGRDLRTPYLIALAAGHVEVVTFLQQAEDLVPGQKPARPDRRYCKAYQLRDLRQFSAWFEDRINWKEKSDSRADKCFEKESAFTDESIVFVHQDHTVTESMWQNENVIFNQVTNDWKAFCAADLNFHVPDDLDLIVAGRGKAERVK